MIFQQCSQCLCLIMPRKIQKVNGILLGICDCGRTEFIDPKKYIINQKINRDMRFKNSNQFRIAEE